MKKCKSIPSADFFLSLTLIFILSACGNPENKQPLVLGWKNNRAVSLSISKSIVPEIPDDSLQSIQITTGDSLSQSMLGEFNDRGSELIFMPVVPFTRGLTYRAVHKGKILGEFMVPFDTNSKKPTLSIYPSQDTLPENILKMYFHFSEPMVEGQSLDHIYLQDKNRDTLSVIFLELKPELWNVEGTLLTLWFDPGRIKRDLIPNQQMGNPLQDGEAYTLHVSGKWKSKNGLELIENYSKPFVACKRDEKIPNINGWHVSTPKNGTLSPLLITFQEPLDFTLIQSTIRVLDENKKLVAGEIQLMKEETGITFAPASVWNKGNYLLQVEQRLEDLAGNNLFRPFDRDLKKEPALQEKKFYGRDFVVE